MEELDKLINDLERQIEEIKLHTEILIRCKGDSKDASRLLLDKNIEDGMIANFHNASETQLDRLKGGEYRSSYSWRYYDRDYVEKLIDLEILRKKREKKLNRIISED